MFSLTEFNDDVAAVTISMNKVVFHQHLKECHSAYPGNNSIEDMSVILKVGDRSAFNKGLGEH